MNILQAVQSYHRDTTAALDNTLTQGTVPTAHL